MRKKYLLDTNIISEFSKKSPNCNVIEFYRIRRELCAISAITWQELTYGINRMPDGKRKDMLSSFIDNLKQNIEIIPYDDFSAEICGKALTLYEKSGLSLAFYDTQIAATAISNGMVLVTHNTKDFAPLAENSFLQIEDWFSA